MTFTINQTDTYENNVLIANEYLRNQTGLLSTVGDPYLIGAGCTQGASSDYPNLQLYFLAYGDGCAPGKVGALRSDRKRQITANIANLHPKSRGKYGFIEVRF